MEDKYMKEKILDLLADICEDNVVKSDLDIDLFETDLLDSLAFAELLFAVEENFGVIIAPSEIERDDMSTPNKIIELIKVRIGR